jgi:hypothetical protein
MSHKINVLSVGIKMFDPVIFTLMFDLPIENFNFGYISEC